MTPTRSPAFWPARDFRPVAVFALFLLSLYSIALWVSAQLPSIDDAGIVALGLTLDLLLWPVVGYLIVARRYQWPLLSAAPVFVLSCVVAYQVMPAEHEGALDLVSRFLVPAVELFVLSALALTVHRTARLYRLAKSENPAADDVFEIARQSLQRTVGPRVADIVASEFALFYYAFFCWRQRPATGRRLFSHHEKSLNGVLTAGLIMVTILEIIPVHLLLQLWSPAAAWVVTALTAYGFIWFLGDYHAMRLRPHVLSEERLHLRVGLRWSVEVPLVDIARLERRLGYGKPAAKGKMLKAVALGEPQFVIDLKRPATALGLYGLRRKVESIGFTVDDPMRFEALVRPLIDWVE